MMSIEQLKEAVETGKTSLGIEFGSTRIKAVLIGPDHSPIASGGHSWENHLEDGIWTYPLDEVWNGLQDCYAKLCNEVQQKLQTPLKTTGAICFSAMMHGYLAFDKNGALLTPFRTWRNTNTQDAAEKLTHRFGFNIPQRWSVAHLYQAVLNGEEHLSEVSYITTLAGYVHWKLTGRKVLGIGDASGMFPIDSAKNDYSEEMLNSFDELVADKGYSWKLRSLLPTVLTAGAAAGVLTAEGAKLIDPTGNLEPGIPLAAPEGDAGSGMVATNSVAARTGNISAGTSVFAMAVLEQPLSKYYTEIDMVTTPAGRPVAMVHCNNCTSDINAWAGLLQDFAAAMGIECSMPQALDAIFYQALQGDADCGGLMSYNYYSGEPITELSQGRPLFMRLPDAKFTFANFARTHLYSAIATLKLGMDILLDKEHVVLDVMYGHGGFFKAKSVGQKLFAAALSTPMSVMETAGEGGPWGAALLAAFHVNQTPGETLEDYLTKKVFAVCQSETVLPDEKDGDGFEAFMCRYEKALETERAAVRTLL